MLFKGGWKLNKLVDVSDDYKRWYKNLLEKLKTNEKKVFEIYGKEYLDKAYSTYTKIYQTLLDKKTGGIIVYAQKI